MKRFLTTLCLLLTAPAAEAAPDRALLYSHHAVLVSENTPQPVISFLATEWGALVFVPSNGVIRNGQPVYGRNQVLLPEVSEDSAAATVQLKTWKKRWGISLAIVDSGSASPHWAAPARGAGLRVFERVAHFQSGDVAIPVGEDYLVYRGDGAALFEGVAPDPAGAGFEIEGEKSELGSWSAALAAEFGTDPVQQSFKQLLKAISYADTLGISDHPAATSARLLASHWRAFLAFSLAPDLGRDTLELYKGVPKRHTLSVASSVGVPLWIQWAHPVQSEYSVDWQTEFPHLIDGHGRSRIVATFDAAKEGRDPVLMDIGCAYEGVQFTSRVEIPVISVPALEFRLSPPILFASNAQQRSDPDHVVKVIRSELHARNWSHKPLIFELGWTSDRSIDVSPTPLSYTLQPGASQVIPVSISIPRKLKYKEYGFKATATYGAGHKQVATGHIWRNEPKMTGTPLVCVINGSDRWLKALEGVGISVLPLHFEGLSRADLTNVRAIVVPAEVPAPTALAREALLNFVSQGKLVIVDLSTESTKWLPWTTPLVFRPGPFSASFYKPEFKWWGAPNGLVGGCYAASNGNLTATLPAGIKNWDPLIVDQSGKGFMYRRRAGKGWFVAVHPGWGLRLGGLDRRALLGMINLVGRRNL